LKLTSILKLIGLVLIGTAGYLFLRSQPSEVVLGVLFALFFLFILANMVVYMRQGRGFEQALRPMGFTETKDTAAFDQRLSALKPGFYSRAVRVINRPHYQLVVFVMMGTNSDGPYSLEYPYAAIISPHLSLPYFTVLTKGKGPAWATNLVDSLNSRLEKRQYPAIDLPNPAFEGLYLLFGPEAGQVRSLLNKTRIDRLIAESQATTIIGGGDMLIYTLWPIPSYLKPGRKLSPSQHAQTLVNEAETLLDLFGQL
jgi:hypothetical protein